MVGEIGWRSIECTGKLRTDIQGRFHGKKSGQFCEEADRRYTHQYQNPFAAPMTSTTVPAALNNSKSRIKRYFSTVGFTENGDLRTDPDMHHNQL